MSGVNPIGLVVEKLQTYLHLALPGAVTTVNALRAPVVKSAAGPFTVPSLARLRLGTSRDETTWTTCPLTSGTRTAAQVAADITTAAPSGITASTDADSRVVLTGQAPSTTAPALVVVGEDVASSPTYAVGGNAALGWEPGGEVVWRSELRAPTWRGITDGLPNVVPDMGQGFWVIIDDREAAPVGGTSLRREEWEVRALLRIVKAEYANMPHRNREGITAAVRAVVDALLTATGRYLGGDGAEVLKLEVLKLEVSGSPVRFAEAPNLLHDSATIAIGVRVFQLPTS